MSIHEAEDEGQEFLVPLNDENEYSTAEISLAHQTDDDDGASVGSAWAPLHEDQDEMEDIKGPDTKQVEPLPHHDPSLPERIGSSALWGSIELLKIAGGFTLSTTGKIVTPPLVLAQQVLLPSLWEYLKSQTPQRLKDWLRIIGSSLHNFVTVLKNTDRGKVFRRRLVIVVADIVDCLSSRTSRQVIVDGTAAFVKFAEALNTPEFKVFLDQCNTLGARLVDAAASGRNKQLLNDISHCTWSLVELASDPATIVALAEVTATFCHTLEMEEALHRKPLRRYEQNLYNDQRYNQPDLLQDYNVTVEQAIMSGLGTGGQDDASSGSLRAILEKQAALRARNDKQQMDGRSAGASNQGQMDGDGISTMMGESASEQEWYNEGRDKVDKQYLQREITERAQRMYQKRKLPKTITTTTSTRIPIKKSTLVETGDGGDEKLDAQNADVEDLTVETVSLGRTEYASKKQAPKERPSLERRYTVKTTNRAAATSSSESKPNTQTYLTGASNAPIADESAASRFYRSFDEDLSKKRKESVRKYWLDDMHWLEDLLRNNRGYNLTHPQESVKTSLEALHRAAREGDTETLRKILGKPDQDLMKRTSTTIKILSLVFVVCVLVWFWFGCYGMYIFIHRSMGITNDLGSSSTAVWPFSSLFGRGGSNEVVIRIVKEVVHVNAAGETIGYGSADSLTSLDRNKIAECVSKYAG